jgi:hypothetical protein
MYTVGRRAATCVQKERLAAVITVEDKFKVSVGKDNASSEEAVRFLARHLLEALEQLVVDLLGAELLNKLRIVDRLHNSILANLSSNLDMVLAQHEKLG